MAVAFGANGAITGVTSASPSINIAYPSGISAGDLLVIAGYVDGVSVIGLNAPSGFSQITAPAFGAGVGAFYKIATGSESGTINMTASLLSGTASLVGQMARFTGVDQTTPTELATSPPATGSGTSVSPSSTGPATDNDLAISIIGYANTGTCGVISGSSGTWTENVPETSSVSHSLQWQSAPVANGATVSGGSATLGTSGAWNIANFAIKPPASAAPVPHDLQHSPSHQAQMAS